MSRVLITGATGFIGTRLSEVLTRRGFETCAALRSHCRLEDVASREKIIVGNINSGTQWQEALRGIECVVHLAGRVHVMEEDSCDPLAEFRETNSAGTKRLAEEAVAAGVRRFIYLSTVKVNGESTSLGQPFTEKDHPKPQDAYALSKWEAEEGLFKCARNTGMDVVAIRPPLVYGPGVKANFYRLVELLSKRIPLPLGAIDNKRSLVALDNLVDLLVTCVTHPAAANQIFFAGDGKDLSTTELLRGLGKALGTPACLFPVSQRGLKFGLRMVGKATMAQRLCSSLQVDTSKAEELLGWIPPTSVDEELERVAEWYWQRNKFRRDS